MATEQSIPGAGDGREKWSARAAARMVAQPAAEFLMPLRTLLAYIPCAAAALAMMPGICFAQPGGERLMAKPATAVTLERQRALAASLPADDQEDFALAARGFVADIPDRRIVDAAGRPVRDLNDPAFFARAAPDTVNPSLWRNAQLLSRSGLFKVTDRIYQVRGTDISNMSVILGKTGLIVVDPLTSVEAASAAIALVRRHLRDLPVVALIYTHSHIDHYGGGRGVLDPTDPRTHTVPVLAPAGFLKEAVSENVIAGPAMSRRILYMSGAPLRLGDTGVVSMGIGPGFTREGLAPGTIALIPPTKEIARTGETMTIDGVRIEFQLTPNSEAPAEMNLFFPDLRALCLAENANSSMHNILTPRGALVRDSKAWADYLTESIRVYGDRTDTLFTSHFWPHWGQAQIVDYLSMHRDAYAYLHDQSVRMMNDGLTGAEIAERIKLPNVLANKWYNRGYYGTIRFNAKAVYQRYLGWYDGNPANLDALPPEDAGLRYVAAMGGPGRVVALGRTAFAAGDYRWAAEILSRLVFAAPDDVAARELLADTLEQLGYQSESAAWRNIYLSGALDLRRSPGSPAPFENASRTIAALPLGYILDMLAVRLVPERALAAPMRFELSIDGGEAQTIEIRNGVLIHQPTLPGVKPAPRIALARAAFVDLIADHRTGALPTDAVEQLTRFAGLFQPPMQGFGMVTPRP